MRYQEESSISHSPLWIKDGSKIHRVKLTYSTQSSYFIEYEQIGFYPIPLEFNFVAIMSRITFQGSPPLMLIWHDWADFPKASQWKILCPCGIALTPCWVWAVTKIPILEMLMVTFRPFIVLGIVCCPIQRWFVVIDGFIFFYRADQGLIHLTWIEWSFRYMISLGQGLLSWNGLRKIKHFHPKLATAELLGL